MRANKSEIKKHGIDMRGAPKTHFWYEDFRPASRKRLDSPRGKKRSYSLFSTGFCSIINFPSGPFVIVIS